MNNIKHIINMLWRICSRMFTFVFGSVSWTPPSWLKAIGHMIYTIIPRKDSGPGIDWKALIIGLVIIAVLSAAAFGGYRWNKIRKSAEIQLIISSPALTVVEDAPQPDSVSITFGASAARIEAIGKPVKKGIGISPFIEGEWVWESDSILKFTPKNDWAVGQEYTVRLSRELFPKTIRLARYTLGFSSQPFTAKLDNAEFYQDPADPIVKKIVATLTFSHPVDTESLEKNIHIFRQDKDAGFFAANKAGIPFEVQYNKFKTEAYIHTQNLEIQDKDTLTRLSIAPGVRSDKGGPATRESIEQDISIPGRYNFLQVNYVELTLVRNENYEPEQVMVAGTTTGVQEDEIINNTKAYLLPQDLPPMPGQKGQKNYRWSDPAIIGPEILAGSKQLDLIPVPQEHEYEHTHCFKYQAPPGSYLYIQVKKNMRAFGGYLMAKDFDTIKRVPEFPKELNIMHQGSLLCLSGEKKLSVYARDLKDLRFEIGRVLPDRINHLITQTRGDITNPEFKSYSFKEDDITERFTEIVPLPTEEPGKAQYTSLDFSRYLDGTGHGLFFLRVQEWDKEAETTLNTEDKRLIMITDLGVLVKNNADSSHELFVQSIHSGQPVAEAVVEVLGKNGLRIFKTVTDENGHAGIPSMESFEREKTPTAYLVTKGKDLSFLPYKRDERVLNLSRFDIGGEYMQDQPDRLLAYLFSDRGIYRPGDEFHIGVVIKSADWRKQLEGIPLEAVITDSRGLEIKRQRLALSASGFEELSYKTEESAPTGAYSASIYLVEDEKRSSRLGSVTVKVEEFLPDRLNISSRFSTQSKDGWVSPDGLEAMVTLKNLYGTPAVKHRITASMVLSPAFPVFNRYTDYTFFDPQHTNKRFAESLQETVTDENGGARFALNLDRFEKATYRLTFLTEGFELDGGRGVNSQSAVLVSPLPYLVGFKPDGDLDYISKASERSVDIIAINPQLDKIGLDDLQTKLIEVRYVSVLTKQDNGTYAYQSVKKETILNTGSLSIDAGGTAFRLPSEAPGNFILLIMDKDGVVLNKVPFTVAGMANLTRSLEKNAELEIKLNKRDFEPGEEIELNILSPYTGAGLITIERERVYAWRWFKTSTTNSVQRIRIPEDFDGNGYVNVSFVRAIDSREIFMSPLSYGVMPFTVKAERHKVELDLQAPALVRPGEEAVIRYSASHKGRAVIYAVDEGILQVARYTNPDPLGFFLKKRALEVQTMQILDLILPEESLSKALSAPGGDEFSEALGKNLNPFKRKRDKPVVFWSGIVDIDTSVRELTYRIPDYFNGTLRIMAVAVSDDAVGTAVRKTTVRGPFVLSPNVPMFVTPGDDVTITVAVANNVENSGPDAQLNITLKTSEHIQVLKGAAQSVKISEGREGSASFSIRVKPVPGSARFTFTAGMGEHKTSYTVETSVRPAAPYMTAVKSGVLKAGKKADLPLTRNMYPDLRTLNVSASVLPLSLAHGLVAYLENYPYGCSEQITSQAFPVLVLKDRPEFSYLQKDAPLLLEHTMNILHARQNAEGAFGFWAANSHVNDFQCVYIMHFLIEANERGYNVPSRLMQKGMRYLHALARKNPRDLNQVRIQAYAIYILTRSGEVTTPYLTGLRGKLDANKELQGWEKDITAIYMAGAYQILRLDSTAASLLSDPSGNHFTGTDYNVFYDELSYHAQYLSILARHFPDKFRRVSGAVLETIVDQVSIGMFSTTSSAYTVLALDAYAKSLGDQSAAKIDITEMLAEGPHPLSLPPGLFPQVNISEKAKSVRIESSGNTPVYYQFTQAGFDTDLPKTEIKDKLEIYREFRDASGYAITSATLGSEVQVEIKIRGLEQGNYENVAMVDLLPAGFEVVLNKSRPQQARSSSRWTPPIGSGYSSWIPDFIDIREDRVIFFGAVGPKVQSFTYTIKATSRGVFNVPPVYGESMYDRSMRARGLGSTFTVE